MTQKNPCQGKHREFGNFAKTQGKHGIRFAQVVNSMILKVKDILRFAANSFFNLDKDSFVDVIVTNQVNWHRENLPSDRENTGNLKMQFEWVSCSK